ncbi:hypothetical protein C8R45DRAFT_937569 [Mycena sanguinolenta]|nr:hypothetical protein C8R45DRAFT_937569 [Mycena sanguinolenta]
MESASFDRTRYSAAREAYSAAARSAREIYRAKKFWLLSIKAAWKVRENDELTQFSKGINAQLADLKKSRQQATAKEKALREQLKVAKGTSTGTNESGPALHSLAAGTNIGVDLPFSRPRSSELTQDGVPGADFNFDPQFIDLSATSGLNGLFVLPDDDTYFPNYCVPESTTSESLMLPDSTMQTP